MKSLQSIWTSITGSISSVIPLLFACCKSGACVGVCASPITSLFGISTASFAASPWFNAIEPILIALSAVSFTVSYYSLYVLPKLAACNGACDCSPTESKNTKISKVIFWIGLLASLFFFTYFEVQKFKVNHAAASCSTLPTKDSLNTHGIIDTSADCCGEGEECK
ncbi:MAG: hypothetical protein IPI46_09820 [Bacteroidetes bacterium]|nr:hypothetical protein [Bacteroidota bacterium]